MHTWIQTHSGRGFDFADPDPRAIVIEDIAYALSMLCRYTGHTRAFYSVAQHSVLVSSLLPPELQLAGLMHDATEAFVGDVSSPLKSLLPEYRRIEDRVWEAIATRFALPRALPPAVKHADLMALQIERRVLLGAPPQAWDVDAVVPPPYGHPGFTPLVPKEACRGFLNRWAVLSARRLRPPRAA